MKWRDHGMLFKMWPSDLPLLFGPPREYDLAMGIQTENEYSITDDQSVLKVAEFVSDYGTNN